MTPPPPSQVKTLQPITVSRHRARHATLSQYTHRGHGTPCPITVYYHQSQDWDTQPNNNIVTGHCTSFNNSMLREGMASYSVTIYTGHDTSPNHTIQTQDITPHPITLYRHKTLHPTQSHYTDIAHDNQPYHSIQTRIWRPIRIQNIDEIYSHRA